MPRIVLPLSLALALLLPPAARAQLVTAAPPAPPVNQEGMKDFCIYRNEVYSLGAELCVPNANAGIRCVPGDGAKTAGRAFWSFDTRDWPTAPEMRCGGER